MNKDIQGCPYSTDPSGNAITFDRDVTSLNDIPRLKRQSKQIFTMNQYTPRERSEIVEIYIQQKKSIVKTQRAFKTLKNVRSAPSKNTIKRLYEKLSTGKALSNPKRPYKSRPRRSAENIAAVRASVERSPRTSQKRRSQQLGMARSTLQRIIRIDLHLFPYKIQLTQRMLPADKPRRLEWAQRSVEYGQPIVFYDCLSVHESIHFL